MKIIEIANGYGDGRPTDPKSVLEERLANLHATVRQRQKDWTAALAAAAEFQANPADVIRRERSVRIALEQHLAEQQAQHEIDLARAEAVRDMIDEQIREAALEVERARRAEASAAALVTKLTVAEADAGARLAEREEQFVTELSTISATRDALEQQLSETESALGSARHGHALAVAEVERLTRREAQLITQSTAEAAARSTLERRVAETEAALLDSSEQLSRERHRSAERLATYQKSIEREMATRRSVEEALASTHAAHADAEKRHESTMATAAARLSEREADFETELSSIRGIRDSLEQQLRDVEVRLTHETESRSALQQALTELRLTAVAAEQRFREQTAALVENADAERVRLEAQMSRQRDDHEIRLADEQDQRRSAVAAAATQLAEREAQFAAELSSITGSRDSLVEQLRDVEGRLNQANESRRTLEQAIADVSAAAADAERKLRGEIATITENASAERARLDGELSRQRRHHESELASITAARNGLEQQLRDVDTRLAAETESRTALEHAITELRSAAVAAQQRFHDEINTITENACVDRARLEDQMLRERHVLELQLAEEQTQHRSAMAVAATRLAEREAQFATELSSVISTRDGLELQLADVEARLGGETGIREERERSIVELQSTVAATEQRFHDEIGTLTENARAERARLEDQLSRERHEHEAQLADGQEQHRSAMAFAATRLAEREAQFGIELSSLITTRDGLEQQLRVVAARLQQETESRTALEQAIADLRSAAADAEIRFRDNIATITGNGQAERERLHEQISQQRALYANRLAERGAEFEAELKRLSAHHAHALGKFQAAVAERDSRLEEQANASAALQQALAASETENRRQFEQTPVPLIRCTREGVLADANHAFAKLVGCRARRQLRDKNLASTLFESCDDLAWLIERSVKTAKTEAVETTCIKKNGARVAVRLLARPSASGLVEIAVEDLTAVRVLEDRLREAHRMEAVGRLASEIAGTCEKLLGDVYRDAQRLLTMMSGTDSPQHSEALLGEVTRVGTFLHQLVAYGDGQAAALAPVDVNRILRDVEPVLRQVAGDAVTLELRKAASPVNVEVNAERVERLLVNVASYGRERMPHGGRLRIELSTVVVDGKFIAQHPNVRQGPHALITVTEVARPVPEGSGADPVSKPETPFASGRPGVDLGALQELISECGGHLWITAEPGGSMVVKMRLPLRAPWEGQADRQVRRGLGRVTARLLGR